MRAYSYYVIQIERLKIENNEATVSFRRGRSFFSKNDSREYDAYLHADMGHELEFLENRITERFPSGDGASFKIAHLDAAALD